MAMTPREIAAVEAQARELESAATRLRRAARAADDAEAVRGCAGALVIICSAEAEVRHQILETLDKMRDQRAGSASPRTSAAVRALEDAMRDAVDQMPDFPEDC